MYLPYNDTPISNHRDWAKTLFTSSEPCQRNWKEKYVTTGVTILH